MRGGSCIRTIHEINNEETHSIILPRKGSSRKLVYVKVTNLVKIPTEIDITVVAQSGSLKYYLLIYFIKIV